MKLFLAWIAILLTTTNSAFALSKAAAYLMNQEVNQACDGRPGSFAEYGVIERDLTGDGLKDLVLSHEAISCQGDLSRSLFCGTQVCTVKIFVRQGRLLKVVDEFLGGNIQVDNARVPAISTHGHGGGFARLQWNGREFAVLDDRQAASRSATAKTDRKTMRKIQTRLNSLGFASGSPDGVVGRKTRAAIRAFQASQNLSATGNLTQEEVKLLFDLTDPVESAAKTKLVLPNALSALSGGQISQNAAADVTSSREDGVVYHRLGHCEYERGLAHTVYSFGGVRPNIVELTDICFDREEGRLWASEPMDGLTLVKKENSRETYEVIVQGKKPYERTQALASSYDQSPERRSGWVNFSMQPTQFGPSGAFNAKQHKASLNLFGHLYEFSGPPNLAKEREFTAYVSGLDYLSTAKRGYGTDRFGSETPQFSYEGNLVLDEVGGAATGRFRDTVTDGDGTGDLSLSFDENGEITGSATFQLKNARLAGANPQDWKTTEWTTARLVGQFVGEDGEEFVARGVTEGTTIDHDGVVNPVLGTILIHGFRRDLYDE